MTKKNWLSLSATIFLCGSLLVGCGSSSSGGQSGSQSGSNDITTSGVVIGSLYENAKVCLDANGNGKCDAGETSTTSATDGTFSLTGNKDYDVVAEIGTETIKHEVAGDNGIYVTKSFTFIAPRAGTENGTLAVSAISTKVWAAMEENNETLEQAKTSVAATISGVDATDLLKNFHSSGLNTAKKEALQTRATAETINIKKAMVNGNLNLSTLKEKMTEDVVSATIRNTAISGLNMPNKIDAIKASSN